MTKTLIKKPASKVKTVISLARVAKEIPPAEHSDATLRAAFTLIKTVTGHSEYRAILADGFFSDIPDDGIIGLDSEAHTAGSTDMVRTYQGNVVCREKEEGVYLVRSRVSVPGNATAWEYIFVDIRDGIQHAERQVNKFLTRRALEQANKYRAKEDLIKSGIQDRIVLPARMKTEIFSEIEAFINGQSAYKDLGLPWKRGLVFYGPPGNGKSTLIRGISEYFDLSMVDLSHRVNPRGEPVLDNCNKVRTCESGPIHGGGLTLYDVVSLLYPARRKPTLYYIEDLDKQIPTSTSDSPSMRLSALLNVIDGVEQVDGALFIATTNHANDLAEALMSRPGRFDSLYEIGLPDTEQIMQMLKRHKLTVSGKEPLKMVEELKGYSMAFVEEVVKVAKMVHKTTDLTESQAVSVLRKIHDHNAKYKKHFKGGVGFQC